MAQRKSEFLSAFGKAFEIFKAIVEAVKELGGGDEDLAKILTSKKLRKGIAQLIVGTPKCMLHYLKSVTESIAVSVEHFTKDSFFGRKGLVKLYYWDNFKNWILSAIPEVIPTFTTTLSSFTLTRNMYDRDILTELGNPTPFTISEFAAILKELLSKQSKGESGELLDNGYANIFYVLLEDGRTVAVNVDWCADSREWNCSADDFDNDSWLEGSQVFVRS